MITVIPAIDLIDGNCVRLTEGNFDTKKIYYRDPVDAAKLIEGCGLTHLHVVDLDNAKAGKVLSLESLERIASSTSLTIDYGGGVKTLEELKSVFEAGVDQVNIGSLAVHDPDLVKEWLHDYSGKIILSADAKNNKIATAGWQSESELQLQDFIQIFTEHGLEYITSTDISKDGKLGGPSFEMYEILRKEFPSLNICASGGVTRSEDIEKLQDMGINRVIVGKAIYEGVLTFGDLAKFTDDA